MDDNTLKFLLAVIALISAVVTPMVVVYVTRKQNVKIDSNQSAMTEKVDGYHKEVNSKMTTLLETTKELATAKEKAKQEGEKNPTKAK